MTRRPVHDTSAFVLRCMDYGESDRIVTFYTERFGKLKGIAKGARRSRKRFSNALEPYSLLKISFSSRSGGLSLIENCDVLSHYPAVREDLERSLTASYIVELTEQFSLEGKRGTALFRLLSLALTLLEEGNGTAETARLFELRLLGTAGYDPVLDRCIRCGRSIDDMTSAVFSVDDGGIFCGNCNPRGPETITVSAGTVKTLIAGKTVQFSKMNRLVFSERAMSESRTLLGLFIRHLLGRELKSLRVLRDVKNLNLP